jgi:mono/diheme cytochrome c family protein
MRPGFGGKAGLNDQEIADIATYVRNSFGNRASPVLVPTVRRIRKQTQDRGDKPFSPKELLKEEGK